MKRNLTELLKQSLSPVQFDLIKLVAFEASAKGIPLYIVGGFVRDLLLRRSNLDIDLVVEGDAPALAGVLVNKYGGKVTIHSRFGTAKWGIRESKLINKGFALNNGPESALPDFLDLVSARSETYKHPASLPTVKMGMIKDDLLRRDFTINTLALRLDNSYFGDLLDDFGGAEDLERGIIRVLHERSFIDDPTRIYRAIRHEKRFGFKIADETLILLPEALRWIDRLSPQRIRHELDLILEEPNRALVLARLAELDLLKPIHADLPWDEAVKFRLQAEQHPEFIKGRGDSRLMAWLLWLMGLTNIQIKSLDKRLHFTAPYKKALMAASWLFADLSKFTNQKPSKCVEYLDELPLPAVYAVYLGAPEGLSSLVLEKYLSEWRHVKPKTSGNDLKKRGLPPGPKYQKILHELRNAWLDGEVKDIEAEKIRLEETLRRP